MTNKPENPPAFPRQSTFVEDRGTIVQPQDGMTLLDWFAGQALTGLANRGGLTWGEMVGDAYNIADAMLKERENRNG